MNIADNDEISKSINQEVEKTACTVINIGRVEPHKTLKKAIDEFHDSYLNLSNKYPEGIKPPYGIFIDYEKSFQNNDIISLKMKSQIHEGGLSRNDKITYLNINTKTGKQIINDELIKDHKLFNDYAEKIIRNQYNITQNKPFRKFREVNIFFDGDRFYLPKNIGITDKEVILYYNPNEINVSTEDGIVLKLNKQEVAPFFTINIL
ncbi:hypothetical protein [Aquimarina sp. MMG016]|uniref:DUF3298 domain-containing protein n=1 Tax=Aquimarina sp. MMG016 TaxID=2822690 RepID=UPI001B3A3E0B|nr:hypothetical protein [Aquimarina sp. MMG016]